MEEKICERDDFRCLMSLKVESDRGIIRATTLGKLFTPNVPLFTKQYNLVPCEGLHAKSAVLLAAA